MIQIKGMNGESARTLVDFTEDAQLITHDKLFDFASDNRLSDLKEVFLHSIVIFRKFEFTEFFANQVLESSLRMDRIESQMSVEIASENS